MNDRVSVIIPVYNVEKYLRQCLDSVVGQTYKNLDIILVDNQSTDSSAAICAEYAAKDDRIKVIYHEVNMGQSASRNDGMDAAAGDWITIVDSDDWLEPDFIEKMVQAIPDGGTDILFSRAFFNNYPDRQEKALSFNKSIVDNNREHIKEFLIRTLAPTDGTIAGPWNKFFRLAFIKENTLRFNTKLTPGEDVIFSLESLSRANAVASCDAVGYHYRRIVPSAMNKFYKNWPALWSIYFSELERIIAPYLDDAAVVNALNVREIILVSLIVRTYFFHPDNHKPKKLVYKEFKEFKNIPTVKRAVWSKNGAGFTTKRKILKILLRMPFAFPVKLSVGASYKIKASKMND